ncbi:MAG: hypothetical protein WC647_02920 [Desulfomonilaceae bacterium]
MKVRRLTGFFIAMIFVLTTVAVFAAGDSYFVIKTKEEAVKAKGKECAKASNQPSKPISPPGR